MEGGSAINYGYNNIMPLCRMAGFGGAGTLLEFGFPSSVQKVNFK